MTPPARYRVQKPWKWAVPPPSSVGKVSSDPDCARKRVYQACDRCRIKKAKCDGLQPCTRCQGENAICSYGARSAGHQKVYPPGYAQILEQQNECLVDGLQKMYRRMTDGTGWSGEPVRQNRHGHPCVNDLLTHLGALEKGKGKCFEEEDTVAMQQRLWLSATQKPDRPPPDSDANAPERPLNRSSFLANPGASRQPCKPPMDNAPSTVWPLPPQVVSSARPGTGPPMQTPAPAIRNPQNADWWFPGPWNDAWKMTRMGLADRTTAFLLDPQQVSRA
ncbi:hypothetical protein BO71DRAFT_434270 [Aspergillus ellipticus CBS 707.79]|uniref:Zn(2)-C6 fungal-type domain-containing protein n=1 Tax=Aspergillus ellipticus CBS 707.79 TaxID=1448320 RepID=A0A319DG13_9EURO|nr:hypothetical protein BO71DRAFT_434270 [Aspergillus ellipticus CBS 707.79]